MFMGEFNHTVDTKGRVIVPSRFREQLGEEFVVTKGMDHSLSVYDQNEWSRLVEQLKKLPTMTSKPARQLSRMLLASAVVCETDRQGRILLPAPLREYAGIKKDAVVTGAGDHVEIWSLENWQKELEMENDFGTFADNLGFTL
jgi:MraZ protein